uniref:Putative ovule protein n=1 Tax=Solanum chacoense TaxID=4108 RepID=A0A0V0H8K7_SOLCH
MGTHEPWVDTHPVGGGRESRLDLPLTLQKSLSKLRPCSTVRRPTHDLWVGSREWGSLSWQKERAADLNHRPAGWGVSPPTVRGLWAEVPLAKAAQSRPRLSQSH